MSEVSQRWASLDILYDEYWHDHLPLRAPMLNSIVINGQARQLPALPTQYAQGLSVALYHMTGFSWKTGPVTGLRALELTSVFPAPELDQLLDIVAASPCLERLSIGNMGLHSQPKPKLRNIATPHLRHIDCSTPATTESFIDLITHLVVQPDCYLKVRMCGIVDNLSGVVSKLFGYICERINRLDQTFPVEVHLDSGFYDGMVLKCPPTNPVIFVRFGWDEHRIPGEQGIRNIVEELEPAFHGTRELRFSDKDTTTAAWRALATWKAMSIWRLSPIIEEFTQHLPHLSQLTVPNAPWELEYLTNPKLNYGWVSPNLERLRLLGGEWQPKLLELLENRREAPEVKTIETIVLEHVSVDAKSLKALKQLVKEVVVEVAK